MDKPNISGTIRKLADTSGIDVIGFADASEFADYAWASSKRRDPKLSLPGAQSIIVAGVYIGGLRLPAWSNPSYGRTSRLYLSTYFLDVIEPLEPIAAFLRDEGYSAVICDSAKKESSILPLKRAAIRAGLGWQGKNALLISRKYGTFLALGGILTDAKLEHNTEEVRNHCGTCTLCQEACPLGALEQPHVLDLNNCLSYLLQVDDLPEKAQKVSENRVGDCEICQDVCSWNIKHMKNPLSTRTTEEFKTKVTNLENIYHLPNLAKMSEKEYKNVLGHLRTTIPYDIFRRNVLLALKNSKFA